MAILKSKEIAKMSIKDMEDKLKELRSEIIKARAAGKKNGKSNLREIKKTIAKILTFKRQSEIKNERSKQNKAGGNQ
jgi:ribosomal protein L29